MKYIKDKWLNTKLSQSRVSSSVLNNSFRVSQNTQHNSDQDSIKYINHKESRQSIDGKARVKRLMSSFGIHPDKYGHVDQQSAEHRVTQWLQQNESNFRQFDHFEDEMDLSFWRKDEPAVHDYHFTEGSECFK